MSRPPLPAPADARTYLHRPRLAHLAGSNPGLIRREQRPYREAAAVASTRADW